MNKKGLLAEHDRLTGLLGIDQRSRFKTKRADLLAEIRTMQKEVEKRSEPEYRITEKPFKLRRPLRAKKVDAGDAARVWALFSLLRDCAWQSHKKFPWPYDSEEWDEFEKLLGKKFPRKK